MRGRTDPLDADTILRALTDRGVEFVVIGGLAVAAHGYVRATKDVDVVPAPDTANLDRLLGALQALDAEPMELGDFRPEELAIEFTLAGLEHGGNWALRTSAGRVDLMQWVSGIESYDVLRSRALVVELPGVGAVCFAGYEDLVAMKRAAGRPEDRHDLAALRDARQGA